MIKKKIFRQEHSKNVPIFELSQFEEGANLKIYIYAENAKVIP